MFSIQEIREILLKSYPEETLQIPASVTGNWSFEVASVVLGAGQTFSRKQGNLQWEKVKIPTDTDKKKAFIPVLLYRSSGETAVLLLEGSSEKFKANAKS